MKNVCISLCSDYFGGIFGYTDNEDSAKKLINILNKYDQREEDEEENWFYLDMDEDDHKRAEGFECTHLIVESDHYYIGMFVCNYILGLISGKIDYPFPCY